MAEAQGKELRVDGAEKPARKAPLPKPPRNLDDQSEQAKIMDPLPRTLTFEDGYEVTLHEPSLSDRKRIFGFAMRVLNDALSLPGINKGLLPYRIVELLNSREDLERQLHFCAAKIVGPAGTISDEHARELAKEIESHALPKDLSILYDAIATIVGADSSKN